LHSFILSLDIFLEFNLETNGEEINQCAPIKKRTRTSWTNEEEAWVVEWVSQYVHGATFDKRINWKAALKEITSSDAKSIFAEDHLCSTKLMECAKRLAKKSGVAVHELASSSL
jgi:hypothetical protein